MHNLPLLNKSAIQGMSNLPFLSKSANQGMHCLSLISKLIKVCTDMPLLNKSTD